MLRAIFQRRSSLRSGPLARGWLNTFLVAIIPAVVAVALYWPVTGHEFVWDDADKFARTAQTPHYSAAFGPDYWTKLSHEPRASGYYRPVASALFALNRHAEGPFVFHLEGVLLHGLICALVALLAIWVVAEPSVPVPKPAGEAQRPRIGVALLTGLFFATHPVHTEAVAFASDLTDLLCSAFYLLALLAALGRRPVLFGVFWMLSLGSKEMAVTLPAVWFLAEWVRGGRIPRRPGMICAIALVGCLYLGLRWRVCGYLGAGEEGLAWTGASLRLAEMGRSVGLAIRLLVWPDPLVADYGPAGHPVPPELVSILGGAAFLGCIASLPWLIRRYPGLALALGWFALTYLPTSNLLPIPQPRAERFLYLPSVGPLLGLALAASSKVRWPVMGIFSLGLIVTWSALTHRRLPDWKNELSLWNSVVHVLPDNPRALHNLGTAHEKAGRHQVAASLFADAHALAPRMETVARSHARALARGGDWPASEEVLREYLVHSPNALSARVDLARVLAAQGDCPAALLALAGIPREASEYASAEWLRERCAFQNGG